MFSSNTSQVSQDADYIEDVFSTWLYTGNGSTQTITNGIDLAGKGGMVWNKSRSNAYSHSLIDTVRGAGIPLFSNATSAQQTSGYTNSVTGFISTGFTLGADSQGLVNNNGFTYASWTFREQPKFFDVVTYTGTGVNRTVAHNLGSVPGCIIVKRTDTASDWQVYHQSLANTEYIVLNTTAAKATGATRWNSTTPTSTVFSLGTDASVNASGGTYVAYIFAHAAGGFGLSGTDNVISCGAYTGNGGTLDINLGYEPQWILMKRTDTIHEWAMFDTLRGLDVNNAQELRPDTADAESTVATSQIVPTASGFRVTNSFTNTNGATYIYIAIRRGPMKVPTSGASVFAPISQAGNGTVTTNFPVDLALTTLPSSTSSRFAVDRLRGVSATKFVYLLTNSANAEVSDSGYGFRFDNNTGYRDNGTWSSSYTPIYWNFRRAPGFFDEVCYTGAGVNRTVTHNLAAVPQMMIVKQRNSLGGWVVYSELSGPTKFQYLNTTASAATWSSTWNDTAPTASVFTLGTDTEVNGSGSTFVAYLFASCPGVSKVGSFTGTGATQVINCGFTGGARFVLIKATSTTGDWYVWDSARGIVAGNDPYLLLNSTAAEVTTTDWVDTAATGFELSNSAGNLANSNGVSYIFLAIA